MEMALAKMKLGPKKDPNSLNDAMASIECRYSIEMINSKKKAQVLRLGGIMYSLVITTTQMIWREKGKELPVATLLNKMHIQWHVAGGKSRDKKGSNDDKELVVPAIATEKKGEIKGGEKIRTRTLTRTRSAITARKRDTWKLPAGKSIQIRFPGR